MLGSSFPTQLDKFVNLPNKKSTKGVRKMFTSLHPFNAVSHTLPIPLQTHAQEHALEAYVGSLVMVTFFVAYAGMDDSKSHGVDPSHRLRPAKRQKDRQGTWREGVSRKCMAKYLAPPRAKQLSCRHLEQRGQGRKNRRSKLGRSSACSFLRGGAADNSSSSLYPLPAQIQLP